MDSCLSWYTFYYEIGGSKNGLSKLNPGILLYQGLNGTITVDREAGAEHSKDILNHLN